MTRRADDPLAQPGTGAAAPGSGPGPMAPDPLLVDPSDAEVEEWAARERQRREAWLSGPAQEERAAWARQERERRLEERTAAQQQAASDREHLRQRYMREGQLAAMGAVSLLLSWSRRGLDMLVQKGREWEEDAGRPGRRRVPLDDEAP